MTPLEDRVWRELEGQLCDVPLTLLDFATRQGIVDRLAPRIAAAISACAGVYDDSRHDETMGHDAALAAMGSPPQMESRE